jgi:hypothetical protein
MANSSNSGNLLRWTLRAVAAGLLLLGLAADWLGIGEPGFGERQALLVLVGALLFAISFFRLGRDVGPAYTTVAVLLVNTVLGFVALNVAIAAGFALTDAVGWTRPPERGFDPFLLRLPVARLARAAGSGLWRRSVPTLALDDGQLAMIYPGWSRQQVEALLAETRQRSLRFDPYAQFREKPFHGRYVNVVEPGFRWVRDPGPWPMARGVHNVWVLGGSTTFGYGLPDGETIPAFLQESLRRRYPGAPIRVYNFGQGYFYSAQELALLQALLASGSAAPEVAIFIDGINEHQREPFYSDYLRELIRSPWTAMLARREPPSLGRGEDVVERWLRHQRMVAAVCATYGIKPLFVWQPAPSWRYDLRYHLLWRNRGETAPSGDHPVFGNAPAYAALETLRARQPERFGRNFLWLGELQEGERRPLYVDRLHYTAAFSREIAERIAERIQQGL